MEEKVYPFPQKVVALNQPVTGTEYLSPYARFCSIDETMNDAHRIVLYGHPVQRRELMGMI